MSSSQKRGLRTALGALLLVAALPLAADEIAPHPSALRFEEREFRPPDAEAHRLELPGGHLAFLVPDPALPLVDVAVALKVGSYLDPPERAGLALLTGALLRRGGTESLLPKAFDERVDFLGAELDSHFGELRGGLSLSVPSWELSAGLQLLLEALYRPRFDADRLADVRANVLEGIGRRNVEPLEVLEREWQWLLYGARSFLTQPLTATTVESITRQEIVEFHRRHVASARLTFAVSGDITRQRLIEELVPWLPDARGAAPIAWPPPPDYEPEPGLYIVDFDTPQAKVLMGHRAAADMEPESRAATRVMQEILGGSGAISRIAGRLRTAEGLVYRAWAQLDNGEPWPRDFRVFFETASPSVGRAIELTLEEIERMRSALVHRPELQVVQQSIASSIRLDFDTAEKCAGWLAEDALLERAAGWTRHQYHLVAATDREAVRQAARRSIDPDKMIFLVVGRAAEVLGPIQQGTSALELALGRRAVRLPARDPLTLQPIGAEAPKPDGAPTGSSPASGSSAPPAG